MGKRFPIPKRHPEGPKAIYSGEVELTRDFRLPERPTTPSGRQFDETRLLVRIASEPIGFVTVSLETQPLTRSRVMTAIKRELEVPVKAELKRQDLSQSIVEYEPSALGRSPQGLQVEAEGSVPVTVIVCTRNRATALTDCLNSLHNLKHVSLDFIIVDNAPADDSTRQVVSRMAQLDSRFRYVCEPEPGLSRARNRGLAETTSKVIAYTDDDVRVDPLWIRGLLRGFARQPNVGCVTGMVASASLELPAEQYFDGRVWWSSSCEPKVFDAQHGPTSPALHPYAAGALGTGANFAVRSALLRDMGGFDETLGAGSLCSGGEDLDAFVRFIRAGYSISYEPAALVWHAHRIDRDDLRRQMYEYGKALSAYLFKYATLSHTALDILRRLPYGLRRLILLGFRSRQIGLKTGFARELLVAEVCGFLVGPFAYTRARSTQSHTRRRAVAP